MLFQIKSGAKIVYLFDIAKLLQYKNINFNNCKVKIAIFTFLNDFFLKIWKYQIFFYFTLICANFLG